MKAGFIQKIIIVASIAAVILSALIVWALLQETSSSDKRVICGSSSDDGVYEIKIVAYGEPFLFGPQSIGIRVGEYGDIIYTEVKNDGAAVDENNFAISWNDNIATIVILGSEQRAVTYQIVFEGQGNYSVERKAASMFEGQHNTQSEQSRRTAHQCCAAASFAILHGSAYPFFPCALAKKRSGLMIKRSWVPPPIFSASS